MEFISVGCVNVEFLGTAQRCLVCGDADTALSADADYI